VYITLAMKIAFISPPVPGHLNPMTTLARKLRSRNNDVVFVSLPDGEATVRAAGLPFLPYAAKEFPRGSLAERLRWLSKLQGEEALRVALQNVAARTEAISVGDQLNPDQIGWIPSNTIIVKRAPQLGMLQRASVCITHAGLNTVLESLAQGVPHVAIPVSLDQPGVAARIAHKKTGRFVPSKELTAARLSLLLDSVFNDPTYRDNARYFQRVIAETDGLSKAADLLESAFGRHRQRTPMNTNN
jgi:UDP:flavonoid glycosyltransferase YjiC (YdhE family)